MLNLVMEINFDSIIPILEKKESEQVEILHLKRSLVRDCSKAIKQIHHGKIEEAEVLINKVGEALGTMEDLDHDFLKHVSHVEQEYVEAMLLLNLVKNEPLMTYQELKVGYLSYLTGMMDLVGELKRLMLNQLRKDLYAEAEQTFTAMEDLYESTEPIQFSNSLLPGFRVKQDAARRQVERARSEIVHAKILR